MQGLFPTHELPDSGGSLALRALAWGTFYAVAGVGSLCFGVWKLLGVHDVSVVVSPAVFDSGVSFALSAGTSKCECYLKQYRTQGCGDSSVDRAPGS